MPFGNFLRVATASLLLTALVVGCDTLQETPQPTETEPQLADAHAAATSTVGDAFTFLQPLAPHDPDPAELDPTLTDFLSVQVCVVVGGDCDETLAVQDASSPDDAQLRLEDDAFYMTGWQPGDGELQPDATLRIAVLVAGAEIGAIDTAV